MSRETMEVVVGVAIRHLPPRQRAVLVLRDLFGWPAADTATLLDISVAAVNSALQRARATIRQRLPARRADWPAHPERPLADRAVLHQHVNAAGSVAAFGA